MERFAIKIDKKLKANLYKICRLCGMDNPDMVPIITEQQRDKNENTYIDVDSEMEMPQKINILLGLSITKDDKMPQTMCCLCVDKINDFYEFREMCYATNVQTRKLLGLKNVKKPALDIKPKIEVKQESIVPTPLSAPTFATNKNGNRKRKSEEVAFKEESPEGAAVVSKKKLRFSTSTDSNIKEEAPAQTKKKLRFSATIEENTQTVASSSKKSKNNAVEDTKLKKEPLPLVPISGPPPAVSNKKLRLAAVPQKELATKKSKQKGGKTAEQKEAEIKEEIKAEVKEEPALASVAPPPLKALPPKVIAAKLPPVPKMKFGCNICKERFLAKVNLEAHTTTTHIPKVERYVCTACNEILSKSFDIKNHQLWHKLSKTPYVCGCCGESILNTYAFSRHLREHAFEIPSALQVLDRECPQCHTSHATNFLYNIHVCAVKTRRCAGCNRLQRNEAEYLKHSAQCAKVYLNYSKHIMPSVEALEDAVRIKNENDVEAAAEEMARLSGVPLDLAPVVQLTRLSSPLIMAASHCVSTTGLDDGASISGKKSGKKGVSKKDLKRVDELLKSTLDALVSIKHEPEVHVDQELPCVGEHSDIDDHHEKDRGTDGFDGFQYDDDSDNEDEAKNSNNVANTTDTSVGIESQLEHIPIKQEIEVANEENLNKIVGGLKLKIKKEHGQLNSSIIEQQKSSEKRAEKRKKKKKHKEKEKEKLKLSKDTQDDQLSQDSSANNNNSEGNVETTSIRIKSEPEDAAEALEKMVPPVLQVRPQPEATIMTSIPMMQFQIACVSSGVEFNNGTNTVETQQLAPSVNQTSEPEDVKPNRDELDRMLKICHVSSGVTMDTDETEGNEALQMDHDGNYDKENCGYDDEGDYDEENNEGNQRDHANLSEHEDDNQSDHPDVAQEEGDKIENDRDTTFENMLTDNKEIIAKKIKKPLLTSKPKTNLKAKDKQLPSVAKSRNKACKSTAKPPNAAILKISAVQSGVPLGPTELSSSDFAPIFIKPEPQYRGYSDEQTVDSVPACDPQPEVETQEETGELYPTRSDEEQNYISSIDFNNVMIKQEKDIEISDVQITQKSVTSFAKVNGIKRKRKQVRRSHCIKDKTLYQDDNIDENMDNEDLDTEYEEYDDENDDDEVEGDDEEEEEEYEEDDEEMDAEEDEEREYRELEYPPELDEKKSEVRKEENNTQTSDNEPLVGGNDYSVRETINDTPKDVDVNISFVIANVCSQATVAVSEIDFSNANDGNIECHRQIESHDKTLTLANVSSTDELNTIPSSESEPNNTQLLSSSVADSAKILVHAIGMESHDTNLSSVAGSSCSHEIKATANIEISNVMGPHTDLKASITSGESQANNSQSANLEQNLEELSKLETQNPQVVCNIPQKAKFAEQKQSQNTDQDDELSHSVFRLDDQENLQPHSITGAEADNECKTDSEYQQHNKYNVIKFPQEEQPPLPALIEKFPNTQDFEVKPETSKHLQPEFEIGSLRTTALDANPEFKSYPLSNSHSHQSPQDNQQQMATIEGVVQESKDVSLEAQPVRENIDSESVNNNENEEGENDTECRNELTEEDNNDHELTLGNNLEELQNYQNQEVLSQTRPTALALHPYLEDISSSSNSLLSNTSSQTPPPPSSVQLTKAMNGDEFQMGMQGQLLLNTEETENILNESNDILSRRALEAAGTSHVSRQLLTQPNLGQQLPPRMPTFNFDNINEIAENNNNANIEREQLNDEQHQYQQQTTNNP